MTSFDGIFIGVKGQSGSSELDESSLYSLVSKCFCWFITLAIDRRNSVTSFPTRII